MLRNAFRFRFEYDVPCGHCNYLNLRIKVILSAVTMVQSGSVYGFVVAKS